MPAAYFRKWHYALTIVTACISLSCAPGRALIDRTAEDLIFWPGAPEKPRISFLWSVSLISDSGLDRTAGLLAGEFDHPDPKTSRFLLRPYSIFVDEAGILYITDPAALRITIVDPKTGESRHIREVGRESFMSPIGVIAAGGKIFASDSVLNKVFIFDRSGTKTGECEGEFKRPTSLALDRGRGVFYVSDTHAHMVYRYDLEGRRIGSVGGNGAREGEFNFPTHIWVDKAGRLYVTDAMNFRIQIFSPEGKFEGLLGNLGDAYHEVDKPKGVAVDRDGNIYVVDSIKDTVKIFNRKGDLLLFFGQMGIEFGQFWLPSGIFIDEADNIYVADTYNGRVQVFKYLGGK
ncbi:MAG: hypothetical protein HZB33_06330 [Nitrospirae bacterium]|nr:hypothetical protein [Nitrospirota bacterium]